MTETPESVVLPRSGFEMNPDGSGEWLGRFHGGRAFLALYEVPGDPGTWRARSAIPFEDDEYGTRDECIAWLDARVLETRAALLPGDVAERFAAVLRRKNGKLATAEEIAAELLDALKGPSR